MGSASSPGPITSELMVSFVAGDRGAFRTVFGHLRHEVFHVVQRYFRGAFDQEEAFQEVWVQIYRSRTAIDVNRHEELGAWTRQVARNRCLDLLRSRTRRNEVSLSDKEVEIEASQPAQLDGTRLRAAFDQVLDKLDPEQRRFFQLCFVEELSHEEIAGRMGISERRSKYLKKKLLARLLRDPALRRLA